MTINALTSEELIARLRDDNTMSERELILLERLADALDEIERIQELLGKISDPGR